MKKPATNRIKFAPPLGNMPVLQYLLPEQLNVDSKYQRSLETPVSATLIRNIAEHWNWDLCQPLVVSRRADGKLYVIDGQHRLAAARLRDDIQQLPAVIGHYDSVEDEAASFVHLNQQRNQLTKLDLFKAAVASGDPMAVGIVAAIANAGLTIAPHSNYTAWKPGMVSNIGGIEACWRGRGSNVTKIALAAMARVFDGQVLRYAGTIFPGIAAIIEVELADVGKAGKVALRFATAAEQVMLNAWAAALDAELSGESASLRSDASGTASAPPPASKAPAPTVTAPAVDVAARSASKPKAPKVAPTVDWNRVGKAANTSPTPMSSFSPDISGKAWCRQCERRKARAEVSSCRDRFCPYGGKA